MNKKISTALVLAALALLCAVPLFIGKTTSYRDFVISEAEAADITAARRENKSLVSSVLIGEQELVYDSYSECFFYSLISGGGAANHDVTVISDFGAVSARIVGSPIDEDMIRNNESVRLLFYNDEYYLESSIKCTTLPLMSIECAATITDEYSPMSMRLYDNRKDADKRLFLSDGQIRKRGGITAQIYPKIPLRIKLQYHSPGRSARSYVTSLLGMEDNNSWVLYPAYNDEDRVRNVFSQNLWYDTVGEDNAFGIKTGPRYRYLEVFVNGRYSGLYALGYTIDEKSMEIDSNDDGQGLFKKVLDTRYDLLEMRNRNEDAVRGYRLISDENDTGGRISGKWRALADYFAYLDNNKKDSEKLLDAIDIDNAIDYALFTDLVQGDDSIYKNFYLAVKKDGRGNTKTLYCPWDLDATWGNEYRMNAPNRYDQYSHTPEYNFFMEDTYLEQIFVNGDTDAIDKFIEKYESLRSGLWSDENILKALKGYEEDIFFSGAYLRDIGRWPQSSHIEGRDLNLSNYREYVLERLAQFDEYFERLMKVKDEPTLTRRTAAYKHFYESDLVLEIKDRDILGEEEYIDFIESIAPIDVSQITDDIRYVVYLRDPDKVLYLPEIGDVGSSLETDGSVLAKDVYDDADYFLFFDDFMYTIFLNGVPCYDSSTIINERLIVGMVHDGVGQKMNTALDYNLEIDDSVHEFYDDL